MEKRRIFYLSFLYFFAYSVLGWCYEVFLETVIYGWPFSNRGFLWGPYCPVYGFGALLLLATLGRLKEKKISCGKINVMPVLVAVLAGLIATVVELITSYLMEYTTGGWLWDYTPYALHFEGRIALHPSVRFAIGGAILLYGVQKLWEKLLLPLSQKQLAGLFLLFASCMGIDFCIKVISLLA